MALSALTSTAYINSDHTSSNYCCWSTRWWQSCTTCGSYLQYHAIDSKSKHRPNPFILFIFLSPILFLFLQTVCVGWAELSRPSASSLKRGAHTNQLYFIFPPVFFCYLFLSWQIFRSLSLLSHISFISCLLSLPALCMSIVFPLISSASSHVFRFLLGYSLSDRQALLESEHVSICYTRYYIAQSLYLDGIANTQTDYDWQYNWFQDWHYDWLNDWQ